MARKAVFVHFKPGRDLTAKASAAITAGTFVVLSGAWDERRNPSIKPAPAGSVPFGVVPLDTEADDYVAVLRDKYVLDMVADGAVKAGDQIAVAANGKAGKAGEGAASVGVAVDDAADGYVTVALD